MILSRFWYFVLTVAAVFSFATALLAASLVNEQWERTVRSDLVRDRFEVEATLKLDARARLDAIAPIAANGEVRTALRRASARRRSADIDDEIAETLTRRLMQLNGQLEGLAGDLLFAVDKNGYIVAAAGQTNVPDGAGLGEFPLVRRALEGHVRDDVWLYNDEVYRMAARPVIDGGQYVGALVHAKRFDDQLAQLLSNRIDGASVGFFRGEAMFASHMPDVSNVPRRDDLGAPLAGPSGVLAQHAEPLQEGDRTEPVELATGGLAVYSLVTGTARFAGVGYAIGRPVRSLASPIDILDQVSGDSWAELPWAALGVGALFVFLICMFLLWLEHDRPIGRLRRATAEISGPEARITITDFGGRYRRITENVNEALDKAVAAAGTVLPKRAAANLDEILGPAADAESGSSGGFFGFAQDEQAPLDLPDVPMGGTSPKQPAAPSPAGTLPAGGLPVSGGAPAAPKPPKPPAPPPSAKAKPATPPPAAAASPAAASPAAASPAAASPAAASPAATSPAAASPAASTDAPAPAAKAPLQAPPPAGQGKTLKRTLLGVPRADDDDSSSTAEEDHFREVFEKFVEMKKKCGENTAGLTLAKFSVTLRRNRDQIIKKHGATGVRFTVYEKGGKAALKATPIKE